MGKVIYSNGLVGLLALVEWKKKGINKALLAADTDELYQSGTTHWILERAFTSIVCRSKKTECN